MECTQRLTCTQELYEKQTERICSEQIGFLGMCGTKYPVVQGPNKIGRDPQSCNIVLNMNSISRQHAVLNVLSPKEFMIMDLDSANKTKLMGKALQPYIPHPLQNGDTVQFGDVFGVFRLLEEDDDLPMTQALDLPDSPVFSRQITKLNVHTTIPESPEVSDKDDSFIVASQPKGLNALKGTNNCFIKPSSKTISIQPVGVNKIDNIYWSSKKKSSSFNDSNFGILNDSKGSTKSIIQNDDDIHNMETQVPYSVKQNDSTDNIFTANTQLPTLQSSPTIHNIDTQLPVLPTKNLPSVCKVNKDIDMKLDIYMANKENNTSIYNAETQIFPNENKQNVSATKMAVPYKDNLMRQSSTENVKEKINASDEIILFDEIESQVLQEDFESQALIPPSPTQDINIKDYDNDKIIQKSKEDNFDDCDTECEDINILPTQKILEKNVDDDLTDCEDNSEDIKLNKTGKQQTASPHIDFQDMATQVIEEDHGIHSKSEINISEMSTQLVAIDDKDEQCINIEPETNFEDLPTQVIAEDVQKVVDVRTSASKELSSTFKVPLLSNKKVRKKDHQSRVSNTTESLKDTSSNNDVQEENFYIATQDIFEDLCSQRESSPEVVKIRREKTINGNSLSNINKDDDDKINQYVSNLSSEQLRDVIGIDTPVAKLKRVPSDSSDVDVTPKKIRTIKFMDIELPNSQEIKSSVTTNPINLVTESSSDSEGDKDSEEQNTPILFHKKKNVKSEARLNLTKKFDVETLPTRIITRLRKPTFKIQNGDEDVKRINKSILKPKFLTEQEDHIDSEIITENISKLKSKNGKAKQIKEINDIKKVHSEIEKTSDKVKTESSESIVKTKANESNSSRKSNKTEKGSDTVNNSKRSKRSESKKSNNTRKKESIDTDTTNEVPLKSERSTRRTRNKDKNDSKSNSNVDKDVDKEDSKKSHNRKHRGWDKHDPSPEIVRRSTRKRLVNIQNEKDKPEKSMVYSTSFETGTDSPKSVKRSAGTDLLEPSSKRTRTSGSKSSSSRSTPAISMKMQKVLFTAFPNSEVKEKLEKLGATIVTDVKDCTVLLTMQIKRTFKLLCAIGLGRPIVGPSWVQSCADNNMIVDPWLYLMKDVDAEKRFHFNLEETLRGKRKFLSGYNVSSTPSVLPNAQEMQLIVECSGGTWKEGGSKWICVSSTLDKSLWPSLNKRGAIIVSTEFILGGVLRQKVDIVSTRLYNK